jgi:hypothetical protein
MKNIDIVLIPISIPILIGIYEKNNLIETIQINGKTSDILSNIFEDLLHKYNIQNIIYTNTPGSFLGIKLVYIYLKTLSICKNIRIRSIDAFYFNENKPIKGIIGKFFIKDKSNNIKLEKLEDYVDDNIFTLPSLINMKNFSVNIEPIYISPAVY